MKSNNLLLGNAVYEFINVVSELKTLFRSIEKLTKKCVHLRNAVEFNITCLNNGIFTKYCNIYMCVSVYTVTRF